MELVEKLIFEACRSQAPAVSLGAAHVMRAGGKRLRPLVLILIARACGARGDMPAARLGAAVELIHTASLAHDDVVDEADVRRGQNAVNTFLGNEASVLMGDYLVSRALRIVADESDLFLMRAICDVIVSMCEAEVLQITYRGDVENTFERYLNVIRDKTAGLFAFTAMAGARVAGADEDLVADLHDFGLNLGIAFQITDDILDLVGVQKELGKPIAADLREGKFTYPVLHACRHAAPVQRQELMGLLADPPALNTNQVARIVQLVQESGGFEASYILVADYASRARSALASLPDSPFLAALHATVDRVVDRRK